jgi:hypothetical protein
MISQAFQAGGDVDAITVNVFLVDDYFADVNAHAEIKPGIATTPGISFLQGGLHFYRATNGFCRSGKFGKKAVACMFYDPPPVKLDTRVNDFSAGEPPVFQGGVFIRFHQAGITSNIGCKDGSQFARYSLIAHAGMLTYGLPDCGTQWACIYI